MVVNFEFLGEEPIENVITCLHFKVDKVVYFGYQELIDHLHDRTVNFLKEYCGVKNIEFHPLSRNDLKSVVEIM